MSAADPPKSPHLTRRHVAAATLGNALEFYDFVTYAFFAIQIGHAFFPGRSAYGGLMLSLATFGAGFVTRPIGALVIGGYADRVGRRPAMVLSFALMGVAIIVMALIPPYARIGLAAPILAVAARMTQGFALGGQIGANTAFLLEIARPDERGLIVSWQSASQLLALTVGGVVGVALTSILTPGALDAYGWRIAFLLGAVALPVGLWLRQSLPETLHASEPSGAAFVAEPDRIALARGAWRVIGLGFVILACATIGSYIFTYIVTYAQDSLHLPAADGFLAQTACNGLGAVAALAGGWVSDRVGRRRINVLGNLVFLLLIVPVFMWVAAARSAVALVAGMALLGVASNVPAGSYTAALVESLPKAIRGGGFGATYSFAIAAFGGTTQLVVTWLIHVTGGVLSPAWYLLGATAIGQIAFMMLPESAPARLARLRSRESDAALLAASP
jgi:MFS family permease